MRSLITRIDFAELSVANECWGYGWFEGSVCGMDAAPSKPTRMYSRLEPKTILTTTFRTDAKSSAFNSHYNPNLLALWQL